MRRARRASGSWVRLRGELSCRWRGSRRATRSWLTDGRAPRGRGGGEGAPRPAMPRPAAPSRAAPRRAEPSAWPVAAQSLQPLRSTPPSLLRRRRFCSKRSGSTSSSACNSRHARRAPTLARSPLSALPSPLSSLPSPLSPRSLPTLHSHRAHRDAHASQPQPPIDRVSQPQQPLDRAAPIASPGAHRGSTMAQPWLNHTVAQPWLNHTVAQPRQRRGTAGPAGDLVRVSGGRSLPLRSQAGRRGRPR